MLINNIEIDVKVKCIEESKTQAKLAEELSTTRSYVSRLIKTPEKIIGAFAFAGGSADKCLSILREKLPSIRHTVSLADRNSKKLAPENESKLSAFIEELKS